MALLEALDEIRDDLLAGRAPDIDAIAADHDLRPVFLKNRADAVIGDFTKFVETHAGVVAATKAMNEENHKKALRARLDQSIQDHNSGKRRLTDNELVQRMDAANALGSRWYVKARRAPRAPNFDSLLRQLARELGVTLPL